MRQIYRVGMLVFLLMSVLILPLWAAETVLGPVKVLWLEVIKGYLPKLVGLLLILVAGSLIAIGVSALVRLILEALQLEKGAKKINIPEILKKGGVGLSLSGLITEIIFFLLIIATLITALEFYGVATGPFTGQILSYIPHVITTVFILTLGILLAIFISGVITLVGGNIRIAQSPLLGNIAKYAIIVVSSLIALRELGLGIILTDKSKDIIFAGLVLALTLAIGLGAKEKAGKYLNKIFKE
jgi:hypothetical protein